MAERATFALAVAVALGGCVGPVGAPEPLEVGSMAMFAAEVEPVLEERCASGGCHGRAERPLELYAPGQHRADPSRLYADEPLTEDEVWLNAERLAAFAHGVEGAESLAVRKPLAVVEGGCWHGGGDVFVDRTEPGYRVMVRWLGTRGLADEEAP